MDYSTQGDANQMESQANYGYNQNNSTMPLQHINNYLIPDESDKSIHDIQDKTLHTGILENGHNTYLVDFPDLRSLLCTSRYLMDEVTGQFYAVFGNSYQCMCTIPRLLHTWEPGQLIDELAATRCAFGCMGPTGPARATQISQPHIADPVSTAYTEDLIPDLTTEKPPSRTVPYQPPSFNLDRPTKCLTKEERLEVHHNYISAVSNLEHKRDLINRLKRSEPHNTPTYEAEMTHHMALHNDVLGRIHTILKQDDYFRTLEELPAIDGLHAYDDIKLFPELFDMPAVIEGITSEANLFEKQLNRSRMYPLPQTPLPSISGFIPRLSSTFQPIMPSAPSPATETAKPYQTQQSQESLPGSSLPCGQGAPTATSLQPPVQPDGSTSSQGKQNLPRIHQHTYSLHPKV